MHSVLAQEGRLARAAGPDKDVALHVRLYRRTTEQTKPLTSKVWAGLENIHGRSLRNLTGNKQRTGTRAA